MKEDCIWISTNSTTTPKCHKEEDSSDSDFVQYSQEGRVIDSRECDNCFDYSSTKNTRDAMDAHFNKACELLDVPKDRKLVIKDDPVDSLSSQLYAIKSEWIELMNSSGQDTPKILYYLKDALDKTVEVISSITYEEKANKRIKLKIKELYADLSTVLNADGSPGKIFTEASSCALFSNQLSVAAERAQNKILFIYKKTGKGFLGLIYDLRTSEYAPKK
jgi:hypothetical protein